MSNQTTCKRCGTIVPASEYGTHSCPILSKPVPAHVAAVRAERNADPIVQKYALCLDCTERETAAVHQPGYSSKRDPYLTAAHQYVAPTAPVANPFTSPRTVSDLVLDCALALLPDDQELVAEAQRRAAIRLERGEYGNRNEASWYEPRRLCEAEVCVRASRNITNVVGDGSHQLDTDGLLTHAECRGQTVPECIGGEHEVDHNACDPDEHIRRQRAGMDCALARCWSCGWEPAIPLEPMPCPHGMTMPHMQSGILGFDAVECNGLPVFTIDQETAKALADDAAKAERAFLHHVKVMQELYTEVEERESMDGITYWSIG